MPWTAQDAAGHNARLQGKAKLAKLWADTANGTLESELAKGREQGKAEGIAIATANKAVAKKLRTVTAAPRVARMEGHGDQEIPEPPVRSADDVLRVRVAKIAPVSLDDADRTVHATLATDAACLSMDMKTKKSVLEVYLMGGIEPVGQVPLCDTHQRDSIDRVKGSVREIVPGPSQVDGLLCIAESEAAAWDKVRGGHITDVSAGFQPLETTEIKPGQTRQIAGRSFTAPANRSLFVHSRWRLREVSLTPIGSDDKAKIRSSTMPNPAAVSLRSEFGTFSVRFNPNHDEQGRFASADAASQSAEKASRAAGRAGKQKGAGGKKAAAAAHGKAHAAHWKAAAFHKAMANYHKSQGNSDKAKEHNAAAKAHLASAAEHKAHMGRDAVNDLHIRTFLLGDPDVNETLRAWLEENDFVRAEASEDEAKEAWDALSEADRQRAAEACRDDDDDEDDEDDDEDEDEDEKPVVKKPAAKGRTAEDTERIRKEAIEEGRKAELARQTRIRRLAGDDVPVEIVTRAIEEGWKMPRVRSVFLKAVRTARSESVGGGGNTATVEMTRELAGSFGIHTRNHEVDCTVATMSAALLARSYTGNQDVCDILGGYQPGQALTGDDGQPEAGRSYFVRSDITRMLTGRSRTAAESRRKINERILDMSDRYRGMTLMDMVDEANRIEGRTRTTYDREERVRAALSGSALSAIFTQNVSAQFLGGYLDAEDTTQGWTTESDVLNFLQNERAIFGKMGQLKKVAKGATAEDLDTSDWNEVYKIFRYGGHFAIDEQDFINDRFGALEQMSPQDMGLAARQVRPNLVYAHLLSNPTLNQDGVALFATAHNNLITTGPITDFAATSPTANAGPFQDGTSAMYKQRLRGRPLNLRPRFVIAGTDLMWPIDILYKSQQRIIASGSGGTYNPLSAEGANVQARLDSRLDPLGVYDNNSGFTYYPYTTTGTTSGRSGTAILVARPGEQGAKTLEVGYRIGTGRAPRIRSSVFREGEGKWGYQWDVSLDIGVKALDFRGLVLLTSGYTAPAATGPT